MTKTKDVDQDKTNEKNAGRVKVLPSSSLSQKEQDATLQKGVAMALQHHSAGRLSDAENGYHHVLRVDPNHPDALHFLGVLAHQKGDVESAIRLIDKALALKPNYAVAHYHMGNALKDRRDFEAAREHYISATTLNPKYAEAYNNLGVVLRDLKRFDEAVEPIEKALAIKPDYVDALFNLGLLRADQSKWEEAVTCYQATLQINPDYVAAYFELGYCRHWQGNPAEATACYLKALSIQPTYTKALMGLAIYAWVDGLLGDCKAYTARVSELYSGTVVSRIDRLTVLPYVEFLHALLEYYDNQPNAKLPADALETVYAIGDSHSLSTARQTVTIDDAEFGATVKLIASCKAWHLSNSDRNFYKNQFVKVVSSVPEHSKVIVMFGEIDCRLEGGILKNHRKRNSDLKADVAGLVRSYVDFVCTACAPRALSPVFYGVPARWVQPEYKDSDNEQLLAFIISEFNCRLAHEAKERGAAFMDVFSLTNVGNGMSDGQHHIDPIHLRPDIFDSLQAHFPK